jgi:hypothetical protein
VVSFILASPPISYMHSPSPPFVLHALPISSFLTIIIIIIINIIIALLSTLCVFHSFTCANFVIGPWAVELACKYIRIELLLLLLLLYVLSLWLNVITLTLNFVTFLVRENRKTVSILLSTQAVWIDTSAFDLIGWKCVVAIAEITCQIQFINPDIR